MALMNAVYCVKWQICYWFCFLSPVFMWRPSPTPSKTSASGWDDDKLYSVILKKATLGSWNMCCRCWHGRCPRNNAQMFVIWVRLQFALSLIDFVRGVSEHMSRWVHASAMTVLPFLCCTCTRLHTCSNPDSSVGFRPRVGLEITIWIYSRKYWFSPGLRLSSPR